MFVAAIRVPTKPLLHTRTAAANEYYFYDVILNDPNRTFKLYQLDTGNMFGISAVVEGNLVLKTILKDPARYGVCLHTINGHPETLDRVYALSGKYPKIMSEARVSNITVSKFPTHSKVNYLLALGKNNKASLFRCVVHELPIQWHGGF